MLRLRPILYRLIVISWDDGIAVGRRSPIKLANLAPVQLTTLTDTVTRKKKSLKASWPLGPMPECPLQKEDCSGKEATLKASKVCYPDHSNLSVMSIVNAVSEYENMTLVKHKSSA